MKPNYSQKDLIAAIKEVGVVDGDIVLVHSDIVRLGIPEEYYYKRIHIGTIIYNAIKECIGDSGTIIVPTFSYSFCGMGEDFSINETPSKVGSFSEDIRKHPSALRNNDPIFSFAAIGKKSEIIKFTGNNSFSPTSSAFKNFYDSNIKILLLGVNLHYFTGVHFGEQRISSKYRYDKIFSGRIIEKNGDVQKIRWIYPVRVNIKNTYPNLILLHEDCLKNGSIKKASNLPIY